MSPRTNQGDAPPPPPFGGHARRPLQAAMADRPDVPVVTWRGPGSPDFALLLLLDVEPRLAAAHEPLDAALEVFPLLPDVDGLVGLNAGRLLERLGDGVEQLAELAHHPARLREDVLVERLV